MCRAVSMATYHSLQHVQLAGLLFGGGAHVVLARQVAQDGHALRQPDVAVLVVGQVRERQLVRVLLLLLKVLLPRR